MFPHLELANHPVVHVGGHHHPVPGGVRQLGALGGDALGHRAPGPIVADQAGVVTRLELGDAGHAHALIMAWNKVSLKICTFPPGTPSLVS